MKFKTLLPIILAWNFAVAQVERPGASPMYPIPKFFKDTAWRHYSDANGDFLIYYEISKDFITFFAVNPPPPPHYGALIHVMLLLKPIDSHHSPDTLKLFEPFTGYYVPGGCFDDAPNEHVKRALEEFTKKQYNIAAEPVLITRNLPKLKDRQQEYNKRDTVPARMLVSICDTCEAEEVLGYIILNRQVSKGAVIGTVIYNILDFRKQQPKQKWRFWDAEILDKKYKL